VNAQTQFPRTVDRTLTPGGYMRSCRQKAGISITKCATMLAIKPNDRAQARHDLIALERNRPGDYGRLIRALRQYRVFAFDAGIFASLAAATASPDFPEFEA
jgi:hypothetical protein